MPTLRRGLRAARCARRPASAARPRAGCPGTAASPGASRPRAAGRGSGRARAAGSPRARSRRRGLRAAACRPRPRSDCSRTASAARPTGARCRPRAAKRAVASLTYTGRRNWPSFCSCASAQRRLQARGLALLLDVAAQLERLRQGLRERHRSRPDERRRRALQLRTQPAARISTDSGRALPGGRRVRSGWRQWRNWRRRAWRAGVRWPAVLTL